MSFNWFALILVMILPACVIIGMSAILIKDAVKKRRRAKRLHRTIETWHDLHVNK